MLISFFASSILGAATVILDNVQQTDISTQQPYASVKVLYQVNSVMQNLKTSGIQVIQNPDCYETLIIGNNPKGFAAGQLLFSFWEDPAFTTVSPNSVFSLLSSTALTYITPTGIELAAGVTYTIPVGIKNFIIKIKQDPFTGVSVSTTDPKTILISSENINDIASTNFTFNEVDLAETVPVQFVKATTTFYSDLLFNCTKSKFKQCIEQSIIDCRKNIECDIKRIQALIIFDCLRLKISKSCPKYYPEIPICPPKPCPQPVQPCPQPIYPPAPSPVCPPVSGGLQANIKVFLDICVKTSMILSKCIYNPESLSYLNQYLNVPHSEFMTQCNKICMPRYYNQESMKYNIPYTNVSNKMPKKPNMNKKKKIDDSSSDSDEENTKESGFSTGVYVAGGIGVVVVVSVVTYVSWQFLF